MSRDWPSLVKHRSPTTPPRVVNWTGKPRTPVRFNGTAGGVSRSNIRSAWRFVINLFAFVGVAVTVVLVLRLVLPA